MGLRQLAQAMVQTVETALLKPVAVGAGQEIAGEGSRRFATFLLVPIRSELIDAHRLDPSQLANQVGCIPLPPR